MQYIGQSLEHYSRLQTLEVNVGGLLIGNHNPIRVQTMTTTDTMDTMGTVAQTIKCIEAGAELVRITAPSKKEAENLKNIKDELRKRGYDVPLVADIHFTPNAAEIAARLIEKVRINPGNYIDKKKFENIEYTDAAYQEEIDKIRERFRPLISICKEYGTAMRIGTNHGSLSDRIMSRYGDTPFGMVESAMEFLRIARDENYHNIVLSMKSSNPKVMVEAYRMLVAQMQEEFNVCYPLHLGVTEAGDGEDGRVKSAVGIGTLLEDGIGDTIRVSLTEEPELEIPVCRDLIKRYPSNNNTPTTTNLIKHIGYGIQSNAVHNIGQANPPVVVADLSNENEITPETLHQVGYKYNETLDKWNISDTAADYIYLADKQINFATPGTLGIIMDSENWKMNYNNSEKIYPIFSIDNYSNSELKHAILNLVSVIIDTDNIDEATANIRALSNDNSVVIVLSSTSTNAMQLVRKCLWQLEKDDIKVPVILKSTSHWETADEHLIHFSSETGSLFLGDYGNGIWLNINNQSSSEFYISGRLYNSNNTIQSFLNTTAFSILQATRKRISKTEYISCPSCGRTLFDLQETTAKIRNKTNHLKGIKIAIMGCIVNGPGEMADADFGYVGSGVGKITLYKGKDVVKRGIDSDVAVDALINLLKENNAWVEPQE